MTTDHTLRHAEKSDVEQIREVAAASWHATYKDTLAAETRRDALEDWYNRGALLEEIEDPLFFVATADGEVVGFVHAVEDEDHTEVIRLYVHPDHWRDGTGTALMDQVYERLADGTTLRAEVLAENLVGTSFYAAHGFERVETEDTAIKGEIVEQNVMERTL